MLVFDLQESLQRSCSKHPASPLLTGLFLFWQVQAQAMGTQSHRCVSPQVPPCTCHGPSLVTLVTLVTSVVLRSSGLQALREAWRVCPSSAAAQDRALGLIKLCSSDFRFLVFFFFIVGYSTLTPLAWAVQSWPGSVPAEWQCVTSLVLLVTQSPVLSATRLLHPACASCRARG